MYLALGGGLGECADAGRQEGVSRISRCSRLNRATGTASSPKTERSRSIRGADDVDALAFVGIKKTLRAI